MSVLKIITIPDSRLKNKSLDVDKYDKELKQSTIILAFKMEQNNTKCPSLRKNKKTGR